MGVNATWRFRITRPTLAHLMMAFLARAALAAFGLWLADVLLPGVHMEDVVALWIAALVLGVVNASVRPIVVMLTLPITVVSLGLFLLVINGAMLLLVASVIPAFHLEGLGTAVLASVIVGITAWIANTYVGQKRVRRGAVHTTDD